MSIVSAIVVYICIWWLVIFCILPIGISSEYEENGQAMGPGAPSSVNMKKKFIMTTVISFFIWLAVCGLIIADVFSFREWADVTLPK